MVVDHALGPAGGAGGVAHRGGGALIVDDELCHRLDIGDEVFVIEETVVVRDIHADAVIHNNDLADSGDTVQDRQEHLQDRPVDKDDVVFSIVDDVHEIVFEQAVVDGVQHALGARHGHV